MAKPAKGKCLTCPRKEKACGLCGACLQAAYRAFDAGEMSRQEAEEKGLIRKSKRPRESAWSKKAGLKKSKRLAKSG